MAAVEKMENISKKVEDAEEFMTLLASLTQDDRERAKYVMIGMRMREEVSKKTA